MQQENIDNPAIADEPRGVSTSLLDGNDDHLVCLDDETSADQFTAELIEPNALTDRVEALIRLTRAHYQNGNEREYTADSIEREFAKANERIDAGLIIVGYDDEDLQGKELGHPEPVANPSGYVVGYDHNTRLQDGKPPAFKFKKFIFDRTTNEGRAIIEPLLAFESGRVFEKKLIKRIPIKFSARALGDCEFIDGKQVCEWSLADGGDAVKNPAVPDAEVLAVRPITDSLEQPEPQKNTINKPCCNSCSKGKTCIKSTQTIPTRTTPTMLGDRAQTKRPRVSGCPKTFRTLGDAKIMFTEAMKARIDELKSNPEALAAYVEGMLSGMSGGTAAPVEEPPMDEAEPSLDGKDKEEGKPAFMDNKGKPVVAKLQVAKPVTPVVNVSTIDTASIVDSIKKELSDSLSKDLKAIIAESEMKMQPVLDEVKKDKEEKKALLDAEVAKKELLDAIAAIETANEFDGRKLENFTEDQLKVAFNQARQTTSLVDAKKILTNALEIFEQNNMQNRQKGIPVFGGKGATVLTDAGTNAISQSMSLIDKSVAKRDKIKYSSYEMQQLAERKKINKPFVDELWDGFIAANGHVVADWAKRSIRDAANVITAADLRNQEGVFAGALLREVFQRLDALQYVSTFGPGASAGNLGRQFKIPAKTFTEVTAGSARKHLVVRVGESIQEVESAIRYNKFFTQLRAIAFRIGAELEHQLKTGVLSFDAVGEMLSDIADYLARETDSMILAEMQHTCDEFESVPITAEAVAAAEWTYSGGGSASMNLGGDIGTVTYGSNVCGIAKLLTGNSTGYTGHPRPIVEPRITLSIDDNNLETFGESNSVTVATLGGVTQVRGYLDSTGSIVDVGDGTTATYAVDNENGTVVFKVTGVSGAAAGVRPTVTYRYSTNYNEFNLTPVAGVAPENHYSGLLRLIQQMSAIMSAAPRYQRPDMCLFHSSIGLGAFAIADLFENQRSPADIALQGGYAEGSVIGALPGISVLHSNGNFFAGARRAILGKKGMSAYAVSKPMEVIGPIQGTIAPSGGGRNTPTPEQIWYAQIMDCVGTPVLIDGDGDTIKHVGRTIRFVGELSSTASA